ncbi:MAG: hypothetical protein ABS46_08785 [Cytophagaceae bacterium SCN 52-12]|nr:MAG: hypothetical protein ABS46_08785 [Cytophagaceae bacterium SCN 52-12]
MCFLWGCKTTDPQIYPDDQVVDIPDPVFERALAVYDSDKTINGRVLYRDIKNIETLFIRSTKNNPFGGNRDTTMSASDLTGIEFFTNLKSLTVDTSKMPVLDLTQNKKLEFLDCSGYYKSEVYYRGLKELKLSPNDKLKTLICDYTWLEELPVGGLPNLEHLSFMTSEKLMDVKVDKNPNLIILVGNGQAFSMDLSHNSKLKYLSGVIINQQALMDKPELLEVYVITPDGVEELDFCDNPKVTAVLVTGNTLELVTVPAGIKNENVRVQTLAAGTVKRCE